MLLNSADGPHLAYAEVVVGPAPSSWKERITWSYSDCCFVTMTTTAARIGAALVADDESSKTLNFGSLHAEFRVFRGNFALRHHPSFRQHDDHRYPWPSWELQMSMPNQQSLQMPNGFLVGTDSPSFPSAAVAFRAFFFGDFRYTGSGNPILGEVRLRIADERGRIRHVTAEPTQFEVEVSGRSVAKTRLELYSPTRRDTVAIPKAGSISIPLPAGIPDEAFIWLKDDSGWIDYCSVSSSPSLRSQRVDFVYPEDPEADLTALIAQGEGDHIEFKSQMPANSTKDEKRRMLKTVVAFAMGGGGTIIFGVEDRTGEILGVLDESDALERRFASLVRSLVRPTPKFKAKCEMLGAKKVMVATVESSRGELISLAMDADKPEYYVRRGATTFYARPEDLAAVRDSRPKDNQGDSGRSLVR